MIMKMKNKIAKLIFIHIFICGCFLNASAANNLNLLSGSANNNVNFQQKRLPKNWRTGRLITDRKFGKVRRVVCRDGSIILSKNRRNPCSLHGGVRRWLD